MQNINKNIAQDKSQKENDNLNADKAIELMRFNVKHFI